MNNKSPLVSVIIPIYGVEKYIERCARSILEQTYDNLEIIFVNDCTPDNSIEILNNVIGEYPNRKTQILIINHEHNKGLAGARLTGLRASTGIYIQNIDSDDFIDTKMITTMVSRAEQEAADITICDFMNYTQLYTKHKKINPPLQPQLLLQKILTGEIHSSVCNKLIRRSLYIDNHIYPTVGLDMLEDFSVLYRLVYFAKKIGYISEPFYYYNNENSNSYTRVRMSLSVQKSKNILIKQINEFISTHNISKDLNCYFSFFKMGSKAGILLDGNLQEFRRNNIFEQFSINDIFKHPHLQLKYKIALILEHFQLYPILQLHRTIYHHVYKRFYNQLYKFYRDYKKFQQSKK